MKYIVVLFWTLILGQVAGYIGASLDSAQPDVVLTLIVSLVVALFVIIIDALALGKNPDQEKNIRS